MNKQILNAFFDQMFEMSRRNLISKLTNLLSIVYKDVDMYITLSDAQNILDMIMKSIPTDSNEISNGKEYSGIHFPGHMKVHLVCVIIRWIFQQLQQ